MITATPLPDLKILIHPTLVDSVLGNELIELDRYVDTYARKGVTDQAESYVYAADSLYQLAWAVRVRETVKKVEAENQGSNDPKTKEENRMWIFLLVKPRWST